MRLIQAIKEIDLRHVAVIGATVAAMVTFMFTKAVFNDGDTYWHLASGRWIVEHMRVPLTDPFSYTMKGHPWQAHEWVADVLMWGAYSAGEAIRPGGGWSGLVTVFGLIAGIGAAMLSMRVSKSLGGISLLFALALALASTSQSILIRPHALMLPILIFWTIKIMEARERDQAPPLWLAPLMILWANLHASYIFGFVVAGAFGLEALWEAPKDKRLKVFRQWLVFGAASLVCILITPWGVSGVVFPFKLLSFSFLNDINEWRPHDFSQVTAFEVALLVTIFVCLARGVKVKPMQALILVVLLQMSLQHRRQVIILALLAPLFLAQPLSVALGQMRNPKTARIDWRAPMIALALLTLIACGYRMAVPWKRGDERVTPMTALQHVPKTLQAMPVLNDYSYGGYLTFMGVRPYIDGRADMYGDEFVSDFMSLIHSAEADHLQKTLDKNKVAWTIFSKGDVMVQGMDNRPGWHRLFANNYTVVHVRDDIIAPPPGPKPPPPKDEESDDEE